MEEIPPEAAMPPMPFPEEEVLTGNTGLLETGQIAPAVPGYGEVS